MSRTPPNLMDVLQIAKKLEGGPTPPNTPLFFLGGGGYKIIQQLYAVCLSMRKKP